MDSNKSSAISPSAEQALLDSLKGPYLASARGKAESLILLVCRCILEAAGDVEPSVPPPGEDGDAAIRAMRTAHGLVGSGASYGFPEITSRARPIEAALRDLPDEAAARSSALHSALALSLDLQNAIRRLQ